MPVGLDRERIEPSSCVADNRSRGLSPWKVALNSQTVPEPRDHRRERRGNQKNLLTMN
jgi:hypothetical protein